MLVCLWLTAFTLTSVVIRYLPCNSCCFCINIEVLRNSISRNKNGKQSQNSRPYKLTDELSKELHQYLSKSEVIIKGVEIKNKHPNK